MTNEVISPLRRRMIEDMTIRKLSPKTQQGYIRTIKNLAAFLGRSPDKASFEDIRRFQLHVAQSDVGTGALNATVTALRFFFRVTLKRYAIIEHTAFVHEPRKLPVVLSPEEMARFLDAAPGLKYKAALSVAYGAGLRASEVVSLKISDIDSERMVIRVEQGKGRKDRYVMLSPHLLELLRAWCKAGRPQGWLFPGQNPVNPLTHAPIQSRLPYGRPHGRDRQAGISAHASAQLCHPSARAEHRHPRYPGPARNGDILPTNNRLKHASPTAFILASARPSASGGGSSEAVPRLWSCTNLTAPSRAFRCG
jgi:integrase/recombinase XerD